MFRRTTISVALLVIAASCTWPMAGQGPDRRNWAGTEQAITRQTVGRMGNGWQRDASSPQEVVGDGSGVYLRSADGLQALDPATGAERWNVAVAGKSVPGLVGDGVVVAVDGPRCGLRRLATTDGTTQATATIGYAYGADATTRSCTAGPSVLTESGRVAVTTRSAATFTVPSCGSPSVHELWGVATTVEVRDDRLRPVWNVTDATIGCGPPPATSPVAPFGDVTRTAAHYVVPKGNTLLAYPTRAGSRAGRIGRRPSPAACSARSGSREHVSP